MKKVKKILCASFAALILLSHLCVFAGVSNGSADIALDNVSGLPGQTVSVNVTLTKNPGITGLRFFVTYDARALTLESAVYTKLGGGGLAAVNTKINPFVLLWNVSTYEFTDTGLLCTLTFRINEGTSAGNYPLRVTWGKGDCIDYDLKNLDVKISGGNIQVNYDGSNCSHKTTGKNVTKPSTCTEAGSYDVVCAACQTKVGSGELAVSEHNWTALIVSKLPSYTEVGLKEQKCTDCGNVRTEAIPMLERPDGYTSSPLTSLSSITTQPSTPVVTTSQTDNSAPDPSSSASESQSDTSDTTQNSYPAPDGSTNPQTGDDTVTVSILLALSAVCIILLIIYNLKSKNKFK